MQDSPLDESLEPSKLVDDYLSRSCWEIKENSNMSYSLQGLNFYLSSKISKSYWLQKIYPPEVKEAFERGDFHIHNLQVLGVYCMGWDLADFLAKGFMGVEGRMESGPPLHFSTALNQVVNFFYTLQGEAAGAQAFSNFDTLLAPFIRYDNLKEKEIRQLLQQFLFNLNVPTRVGFQAPFTNLTLDLNPPHFLQNEAVLIGGKIKKETYGEFQPEIDILNRLFCEVFLEGDARGRVFTFPIPTYNITSQFPWKGPAADALWKMTAKYGIPYFANFINSDLKVDDVRSMCCRLRLDLTQLLRRGGGLFGSNPLTGSIGVVTINLPRIGFLSKSEAEFLERLQELMELAKKALEAKRKALEGWIAKGLYPYSKFYLKGVYQRFGAYWANHFSTIGIIGMNEACLNFMGKSIADPEGKAFAIKVLDTLRGTLLAFQKETQNNYNLEATPAEATSYRLARIDKAMFPAIRVANEEAVKKGAAPFYTNSTQLPVHFTTDPFVALEHQEELQSRYTGGTVLHFFLGQKIDEPQSIPPFVQAVCSKYKIPYFTLTPTFSICPEHGYLSGEQSRCPRCGKPCEVYSRVVGYLRPLDQWNPGKQEEFKLRKTFQFNENRGH
ncbi:ribonucleoside triphosphate reductase [Candidatus Methylacidiphilum infernorum]|uniref:Ribonucleotide reductase of class III (Anaerobic), large subunit n=1 Tax=Methylacidiphilum infernorum (isolate V4) TaxID=481448 RepID=B3E035_METI4|nr:ribonucleoside triphosphate reductase [Candidatus Methylacidiphilum infernorum]ACD82696.1 Ribonucleotide reductase of class III (anaerobic), large subunit [Methylacidiphilum infernorum V4]